VDVAAVRHRSGVDDLGQGLVVDSTPVVHARDAVERAYTDHYAAVFRYALALTHSIDDAEDITSEVFARALRSWTAPPARPLAWLLLTGRRIATDRVRRAARFLGALARLRAATISVPSREPEFWLWFEAVATVLTPRQREALVLRYERDLSDVEIAAILGLTESGVRSLVARALAVLRAHPELL
jgi:RNA polymerase sigma factor (sigma-70 family)